MRAIISCNGARLIYIRKDELLSFLKNLAEKMKSELENVSEVYLFGSLAKGEERGLSDVDLLVVVREKLDSSNFWRVYREIFNFVADRLKMDFDLVVVEESKKEETLRRLGAYLLISKT